MVKSRLKILKDTSVECMVCLNKVVKKKRTDPVHWGGGTIKLLPVLNFKDRFYGFSGDLMETII